MQVGEVRVVLAQFRCERPPVRIAEWFEARCYSDERRKRERQARNLRCNDGDDSLEFIRRILRCGVNEVRRCYDACSERQYDVRRRRLVTTAAPQIHGNYSPPSRREP